MAYVPIPKDLSNVKSKVLFNLTRRQLLCFSLGALLGLPLFFFLKGRVGSGTAAFSMVLLMVPFFLLAMYEKNGQPLEKVLGNRIRVTFLRPRYRPYRTQNFYALLQRQALLQQEVSKIVSNRKTHPHSEKADPGGCRPGKGPA